MDKYELPDWGAEPTQPFKLEVLKRGVIVEEVDVSARARYVFGRQADALSEKEVETESKRENKWMKMLDDWDG